MRASLGRLSFGAMYMSGPPPAAACVSKFVNRLLNGTSVTVTLRPGFAAMTLATILSKASFSLVPDAPYASQIVSEPVSGAADGAPAEGATPPLAGGATLGVVPVEPAGVGVAAVPQALTARARAARVLSTRSFPFMSGDSPPGDGWPVGPAVPPSERQTSVGSRGDQVGSATRSG